MKYPICICSLTSDFLLYLHYDSFVPGMEIKSKSYKFKQQLDH